MESSIYGWLRILFLILPYLFVVGIFQITGGVIADVNFSDDEVVLSSGQQLTLQFFDLLGTFLVLWFFMKYVDKEKFILLGFQMKKRFPDFLWGIGLGAVIMGIGLFILLVLNEIRISDLVFDFRELSISILLFAIVALVEEALFRGYILKNLMESFNRPIALVLSSILFSLAHGANPSIGIFSLFELFLAGILLGVSYLYTRNLWFPIGLHFSWNLFQSLFGFNVSGQDFYSIVELNYSSSNLLNGGKFGFEGSILSAIFSIAVIAWILYYYRKEEKSSVCS